MSPSLMHTETCTDRAKTILSLILFFLSSSFLSFTVLVSYGHVIYILWFYHVWMIMSSAGP
ncbi:hypothetical protein BDV23DRAFT_149412 [Aspergillus alliaceus]|uniref:Uncharacterized protein n=1 Tax=Petromyces alliaceus TaxID=209559 RepID=A0A5N7CIK1_PETAA|nr:hypothetical protein BDV23DRAFT_149412 [Aspergillus alliaceus]